MIFRLQQNSFFLSFGVAAAGIAQKKGRAEASPALRYSHFFNSLSPSLMVDCHLPNVGPSNLA
jgi:hypothetical protein